MKDNSETTMHAMVGDDTVIAGMSKVSGNAKVFFYDTKNNVGKERTVNINSTRLYGDTIIEATGIMKNCTMKNVELYGHINTKNKRKWLKK